MGASATDQGALGNSQDSVDGPRVPQGMPRQPSGSLSDGGVPAVVTQRRAALPKAADPPRTTGHVRGEISDQNDAAVFGRCNVDKTTQTNDIRWAGWRLERSGHQLGPTCHSLRA